LNKIMGDRNERVRVCVCVCLWHEYVKEVERES
jgi:hypothetical protein